MDPDIRAGIFQAVENEPFAKALQMKLRKNAPIQLSLIISKADAKSDRYF